MLKDARGFYMPSWAARRDEARIVTYGETDGQGETPL
jgi:hypothetical protein